MPAAETGLPVLALPQAQQLIRSQLQQLPGKESALGDALDRIVITEIVAAEPVPAFAESTRDGYVISAAAPGGMAGQFRIVDEIAAGRLKPVEALAPGTACRIMTGGLVPEGSQRVIPHEECLERDDRVTIPDRLLQARSSFIRQAGSDIARGDRLVEAGVRLRGEHLELLSSCGIDSVKVALRPTAGYFCTGSELKAFAAGLENGQKVSSNSYLLAGILSSYGAETKDFGIAADTFGELEKLFKRAGEWGGDVLISTGGMGPGKYDLVEQAFLTAGGTILFGGLHMRPGKSMLFGRLGRTLFFALPGPPHAVRTLLHVLVGPALLTLQGGRQTEPKTTEAHLLHRLEVKHHEVLQLKDGIMILNGGRCRVRLAGRLEIPNCHILLHPGRARYEEGTPVEVHLVGEPFLP